MTYEGIIFDFNGVLLWDASLHERSWQAVAFKSRGFEMTEQEFALHMHGRPNRYVHEYLAGRSIEGQELHDLIQFKESLYRELCRKNPQTFVLSPGAVDLLDALVKHDIPRTIATSSEGTNLNFFREHLALDQWFDFAKIVFDDGRLPGKPAPDMYLAAARNIGLSPHQCVVVEDAISGIQSAHAAGIGYIIGLATPATHARLLAQEGIATVIRSLREFPHETLLRHK
jgi:beta-phosphoglucomutase-like phosphatase (HAD superfamily)